MTAPLQFFEATSWDFMAAANVANRLDQDNVVQWTGSVASMQTGHTGSGQCIRNPSSLVRKFKAGRFDTVYARFFFRTSQPTTAQGVIYIREPAGVLCYLGIESGSGNLVVVSGATTWESSTTIATSTWTQVEVMVRVDDTDGAFEVRIDGVAIPDLTQSGVDTTGGSSVKPDRVDFNNASAGNADYDDFTGKVGFGGWTDSDWIGRTDGYPKITTLYPNANGAITGWSVGAGSGALWEVVDEVPANTSDYISSNTANQGVSFRLTSMPAAAEKVHFLKQIAYSRANGSEAMRAFNGFVAGQLLIQHRATNATMNSTWTFREREWPRNERQGKPWKASEMATLQVGYRRITAASTAIDISQIAVEVLWSAADTTSAQYQAPSLIRGGSHRLAKCWRITRKDGLVMRFAAHDQPLSIGGYQYEAVGGFAPTTSRAESGLRDKNQDFVGLVSSEAITNDDLRAGRCRNAMVEEFCVDWLHPDAGRYYLNRYWVGETKWNGVQWEASVNGHARFLKQKIGGTWGRMCRYQFGEPKCFYALHGETYRAVKVDSVSDDRRVFRADSADITASLANTYFAGGRLIWRAGSNYALESVVRKYTHSTREFELAEKVPFDITTSDYFDVSPGCDGLSTTCLSTWDNYLNFGGEPHIPGTDKALSTPDQ